MPTHAVTGDLVGGKQSQADRRIDTGRSGRILDQRKRCRHPQAEQREHPHRLRRASPLRWWESVRAVKMTKEARSSTLPGVTALICSRTCSTVMSIFTRLYLFA